MKENSYVGLTYLKFFFFIVFLFIVGAVILKIGSEIIQSKFRNNAFSVLYVAKDSKLIYVDKNTKEVLYLSLGDLRKYTKGKNYLGVSFALGLPINAMILDNKPPANISEFITSQNEWRLIFDGNVTLKNMNRYDIHKVIDAMRSALKDNRTEERVDIFSKEDMKKIEEHFVDSAINNVQYTIEIENGTSINGLGNQLATILGKEGFNVIAVRTARAEIASYVAYPEEENIYVNSLIGLTGFDYKKEKISPAADITIFLGDDLEAMLSP
ncbi:MAG: LytR C-terminal domain-containing protein [Candidatus Levybacteria bacterium]|nr:LytR C-terminal domain-containing protein [Candidatus Levybacteria bacterium]